MVVGPTSVVIESGYIDVTGVDKREVTRSGTEDMVN